MSDADLAAAGTRATRVAAITRLFTDNAGNEALSTVLGRYLAQQFGEANVRLVDRIPHTLRRFSYDRVAAAADPIAAFEAMVDEVAALPTAASPLCPLAGEADIRLVARPRIRSPLMQWAKRTIRLRSRLRARGILPAREDGAATGLNTLRWADALVWNPAGEIHPKGRSDEVFLILLMVRLAQRQGKPVAIVNHSLEATDTVLNRLLVHVYQDAQLVTVREQGSYDRGLELGFPAAPMVIVPDLAFLLARPGFLPELDEAPAEPLAPGSIVLSINGLEAARGGDGWERLIAGLRELGRPIVFVSNSMKDDIPFARAMAQHSHVEFRNDQPSFREMVRLYRGAAMVISSRLHASIFAMCARVPVLSIEPQLFKLTGILDQLDYPIRTVRMGEPGWVEQLLADARRALDEPAVIVAAGNAGLDRQVAAIQAGYAPLPELLRGAAAAP
ncbi:MAG: polysaccharide pyruvyl transferase family protein [Pseudomonadota bacterium]